ncbi:hypothetical protein HMPREF9127_0128 [Parvimonas sp. oral taxon 393 str. F0440]|nr:hypothetical protein HMPREF9127_0128 [Parvimonas sp. oral taxon 393 str. F0440]
MIVFIQALIYHSQKNEIDTYEEYVLVLGAKANNGKLSKTLINRLDTTIEYLNKHKTAKAVLCGGKEKTMNTPKPNICKDILLKKEYQKKD